MARVTMGLAIGCLIALACAPAPVAAPVRAPEVHRAPLFELHDGAWVNLHHVLYAQGLKSLKQPTRSGGGGSVGSDGLESIDTAVLGPEERTAWDASVSYYATTISARDLTFDDELPDINNALSAREDAQELTVAPEISAEVARSLARAMPVYRAHWWTDHQKANAAWMASVQPYVEKHGTALSRELARLYRVEWPAQPYRVDVAMYASWAGAYTTIRPTHLTISSVDPRNQGPLGFEIVFHETSHALIAAVRDALAKELTAQNKTARDLWHAILFFTTGESVKRILPGYVPYAVKYGLYEGIPSWQKYKAALDAQWISYIDGKKTFEAAIHDVVMAL